MSNAPIDLLVLGPVAVVFLAAYFAARNYIAQRELTCPKKGVRAHVEFVERDGRGPVRVRACSLLNGRRVDCGQACLAAG